MTLKRKFIDTVCLGNPFYGMLSSTSTGTGFNSATGGQKVGMACLDISSGGWFLCTATTGTGTWVAIS